MMKAEGFDFAELWTGLLDAILVMGVTMVNKGLVTREELASVYRAAEQQQAEQPPGVDPVARRLATHTIAEFFSAPIIGDRPALRLVVDNDAPPRPA
jgi:hypothetical protein